MVTPDNKRTMAENTAFCSETAQELDKDDNLKLKLLIHEFTLSSLGFPFAKLLRNFCGTKHNIFLSLRVSFARKNNNLRNHSQKSFRAKLPYSAFAKLKFCAIPQQEFCANPKFCNFVCFLEFNSGKILFWNVFLLVTFL